MRVLLVDDEEAFASLLAERLAARGISAHVATGVEAALEELERAPFDVAVVDVCMPGRDGLDLLRVMRERHHRVEVLMLTGSSDVRSAVNCLRLGAGNYLLKPVDIDLLVHELHLAFDRKCQRDESARMIETGQLAALGRMAEGVAHEINNPLNTMINAAGWVEDLLEEPVFASSPLADEMARSLRVISKQSLRVREITRKLLCFGRGLDPHPQPFDCAAALREVNTLMADRAAALGVAVTLDLPDGLPHLSAPPVELRQVFIHVMENALDAMEDAGGELHVKLRCIAPAQEATSRALHISFADTGHGIPQELLERVFDPFFSTRSVGKGMGLGLSVCYGVVRSLGGEMALTSASGRTVCAIKLPLRATTE